MINDKWSQPESAENSHSVAVTLEHPFYTLYMDLTTNDDHMSGDLWYELHPEILAEPDNRIESVEESAIDTEAPGVEIEVYASVME